ncbi:hypothetical protein [Sphaerisporangium perillae]|uniref:hypothetical protein n=1 Tax=Sphaerisporangium perillae TaxID=2935860 RepID=UPI00200F87D2|nr:hypothetical protein [Sphaerisporangium perillae]
MDRHCAQHPLARVAAGTKWPARAALVIAMSAAVAWPPLAAHARTVPEGSRLIATTGDRGPIIIGNGKRNRNYAQVLSPTHMHGVQHVSNASVIGASPSQSGYCRKKHRVCHISEKMWVSDRRR